MTERVRTTISLSPEVLEIFKRMADAGNMSVSRCMGDWLTDTADAAQMIMLKMEEAKVAPMRVVREMRGLLAGLTDSVNEAEDTVRRERQKAREDDAGAPSSGPSAAISAKEPPSSNTGVLVPPSPSKPKSLKARKTS